MYDRIPHFGSSVAVEEVTPMMVEILVKPRREWDYFIDCGLAKALRKEPHIISRSSSHSKELLTTKGVKVPNNVQQLLSSSQIAEVPTNLSGTQSF